ncbi:MAG: hypothetical protein KDD62_06925 [Bdellovibrionales bacterium]|nr:hypothetical protein [Bdellovibrionales bacterium]
MTNKQKGMTREQAAELYDALRKTMETKHGKAGLKKLVDNERGKRRRAGSPPLPPQMEMEMEMREPTLGGLQALSQNRSGNGSKAALMVIAFIATLKIVLGVMEAGGIIEAETATASMDMPINPIPFQQERFSREEVRILTTLDARRVELEEKERKLDDRERDLERKDREFAARITELRELSKQLSGTRERNDRKKRNQLEQLANVYGAMNPQEAAGLIEQLDVTIALSLLERMPEKRIGQILALMSPEKALMVTRMLSGKKS